MSRNDLLAELASDAAVERSDFLARAAQQLTMFLESNRERISDLGGLTLIDEDPDYLSVAPDSTFRSRTRYLDDATGQWVSEAEVIETAAELVELYNPSDVFAWFADAARDAAGLPAEPTAAEGLFEAAGVAPGRSDGGDIYAAAADSWAAGRAEGPEAEDEGAAAQVLYDLALAFQERSQQTEARLLEQFAEQAERYARWIGDLMVVDDEDERLTLRANGEFRAEVVPEDAPDEWRTLDTADELVEFYDPTDMFGDLADALAEAYPQVAPEAVEAAGTEGEQSEEAPDAAEGAEDEGDGGAEPADDQDDRDGTGPARR